MSNLNKFNLNLKYLLSSSIVNKLGDVFFDLFIIWKIAVNSNVMNAVYLLSGSILFRAVLAMFSGILVDRFNKKHLIYIVNLISILIVFLFASNFDLFLVHINICMLLILLNNICNEIFYRCTLSLGAELSDKAVFIQYQSFSSITTKIIDIIGSALIGFMIAIIPEQSIFALDIMTFIVSTLFIMQIKYVDLSLIKSRRLSIRADVKTAINYIHKSKFIRSFILIMFMLNLAYGFIPNVLPLVLSSKTADSIFFGLLKSSITAGSIGGLLMVLKVGNKVSCLFKISMLGSAICMLFMLLPLNAVFLVLLFLAYGFFDAITQPLFSYTVASIDDSIRGKVMGGIDTIILLSPSLGMVIGSAIMQFNVNFVFIYLSFIFLIVFIIVSLHHELNKIELEGK